MSINYTNQATRRSIWQELDIWAQGLKPWQRFVLSELVRDGHLSDESVKAAFTQFLCDCGLGDAPNPPLMIPDNISGRPSSAAPVEIHLSGIDSLQSVNALPREATLTFCNTLTVVYGANGVGKSGFTRVLANVCFSRSRHQILPDIYANEATPPLSAKIKIADSLGKERIHHFDGKSELPELKRIAVFDSAVAKTHISEKSTLGFIPVGFDVFPEMTRVYEALASLLEAEIERCSTENKFARSFVQPESPVSKLITDLSADTDLVALSGLASFGDAEFERLDEVQRQKESLQSRSVKETLLQLEDALVDVQAFLDHLDTAIRAVSDHKIPFFVELVREYTSKALAVANEGAHSFKHPSIKAIGSVEWESLIQAAQVMSAQEHSSYPHEGDYCVLCQQLLDTPAIALLHRIWRFLDSDHRAEVEAAARKLDDAINSLNSISLSFFDQDTAAFASVTRRSPALSGKITNCVQQIESHRSSVVTALKERKVEFPSLRADDVIPDILNLRQQIALDIDRLRQLDVESAILSLENERVLLRHRQVLSQLFPEIQQFVLDRRWVKAAIAARSSLNPRGITTKESELFGIVIAENYREVLARECAKLRCDMPLVFRTQGQKGQTFKSLVVKDRHSPEAILSEGEQRAVAIADFLTEVSLNPANAGIVLDDPVTSMDHDRKEAIAVRLVQEAKRRQVVVFTHDLVFLSMLVSAAEEQVQFQTHWIERDANGKPGQVCLNDCPVTTKQYRNTQRASDTLLQAKGAIGSERLRLVQRGMAELRRTVEEIIPQFIFKEVVTRWSNRVIVTGLRKINWDESLINEVVNAFEKLSANMEGHSQTDERGRPPLEPKDLEEMIDVVADLVKRSKKQRTIN